MKAITISDYGYTILSNITEDVHNGVKFEDALENWLDSYGNMGAVVAALLSYQGGTYDGDVFELIAEMAADYVDGI